MAWSDAARKAAAEARQRKQSHGVRGSEYHTKRSKEKLRGPAAGPVSEAARNRAKARSNRSAYAAELKVARAKARQLGMSPGKKRNRFARSQANFILSPRMQYGD